MDEKIFKAIANWAPGVFALFMLSKSFRMGLLRRIGTSLIVSTPPAITTSDWPDVIWPMPLVMAWFADIHASVTVCAGILSVNPAARAALYIQFQTCYFNYFIHFLKKVIEIYFASNIGCFDFLYNSSHNNVINVF